MVNLSYLNTSVNRTSTLGQDIDDFSVNRVQWCNARQRRLEAETFMEAGVVDGGEAAGRLLGERGAGSFPALSRRVAMLLCGEVERQP